MGWIKTYILIQYAATANDFYDLRKPGTAGKAEKDIPYRMRKWYDNIG